MSDIQSSFRRYEKKYMLTQKQYKVMRIGMAPYMEADRFSNYTICNIYYDTPDYQLIRASLTGPVYKEKLRMRSYGTVTGTDNVFVELKKRYGIQAPGHGKSGGGRLLAPGRLFDGSGQKPDPSRDRLVHAELPP